MSKFWKISLLILFILTGCVSEPKREKLPPLEPDHYLYEVRDTNGNHLYLLGTIHVGPQKWELDGLLQEAYENSSTIAFEILFDFTEQENQDMLEAMKPHPIKEVLEEHEDMEKVWESLQEAYNLPHSALYYNSSYLNSLILQDIMKELGFQNKYGIDLALYERAKKDEKNIQAIEGNAFQIDMLRIMGEKVPQVVLLSYMDKEMNVESMYAMVQAYALGSLEVSSFDNDNDVESWKSRISSEYWNEEIEAELVDYEQIMLSSRNTDMFEKAQAYLAENDVLLAVGAAHILGETGLVEQFKQAGYKVIRLEEE